MCHRGFLEPIPVHIGLRHGITPDYITHTIHTHTNGKFRVSNQLRKVVNVEETHTDMAGRPLVKLGFKPGGFLL